MGPLFEDDSGKADIHLKISLFTLTISTTVLLFVGVLSALIPAAPPTLIPSKPCATSNSCNLPHSLLTPPSCRITLRL